MAFNESLGLLVVGTADGKVTAFDAADGTELRRWEAHASSHTRSLAILDTGVLSGGMDGTLKHLKFPTAAEELQEEPLPTLPSLFPEAAELKELKPAHNGPVVALTPREGGLLVSGAHDGTLRVWDLASKKPRCLYGFGGYKVWLGSVTTDNKRLVADGSDNMVLVHDFSQDPPEE